MIKKVYPTDTEWGFDPEYYEMTTAGLGYDEKMRFGISLGRCGTITDGISLHIPNIEGGWVISFQDLKELVRLVEEINKDRLETR